MNASNCNCFYILVAASAVGKSALMRQMLQEHLWDAVPKYSTRDIRNKNGEEDDVVPIDNYQIQSSPTIDANRIRLSRITKIKNLCGENQGVVYYKNGNFYGIKISDVVDKLQYNNVAAIISDFHAIKKLKSFDELHSKIRVMYIASTIDERELLKRFKDREAVTFNMESENKRVAIKNIQSLCSVLESATRLNYMDRIEEVMPLLNEEWNTILPYFETIKTRSANIRMLYNQYIENIDIIDYTILNFYNLEYMYSQVRNIITHETNYKTKAKYPPIFMVCAAPSSGKATLMEIVGDLGEVNGNIRTLHKYAKREPREQTDGRDGMIAIGKSGDFKNYIRNSGDIWMWNFHTNAIISQAQDEENKNSGTEYAVSHLEIKKNMEDGIAQIFISNMQQIELAKKYYPDNIVILYLHATHETETRNHIFEKCKVDEIAKIVHKKGCSENTAKELLSEKSYDDIIKIAIEEKLNEINDVHMAFLKYNHQINHVLLNTGTREDLVMQMTNLLNAYSTPHKNSIY